MKNLFFYIFLMLLSCSKPNLNQSDVRVDLRGKHLTKIPKNVLKNPNIIYLDLGSSEVAFYPPLSALPYTNANSLEKLPAEIRNLTNLKTLILNTNKLKALPNSIVKLKKLEVLDLSVNTELDIVEELDKIKLLPNLKVLKIVNVKLQRDDFELVKKSLSPKTKIVVTIQEYFESLE